MKFIGNKKICPDCGRSFNKEDKSCSICGTSLVPLMWLEQELITVAYSPKVGDIININDDDSVTDDFCPSFEAEFICDVSLAYMRTDKDGIILKIVDVYHSFTIEEYKKIK